MANLLKASLYLPTERKQMSKLEEFRHLDNIRKAKLREETEEYERKMRAQIKASMELLWAHCKPVSPKRYNAFIRQWVEDGGTPSGSCDYTMNNDIDSLGHVKFWIATSDFVLPCLHGASLVVILSPKGIKHTAPDGYGHSTIIIEGGTYAGSHFVQIFIDT